MANFISMIRIQTVAIWGILCAPSPLFALPLAAQDDVGAPSNSTPEAQIPPSPTPSLRQMAHEETTNAIKQTAPETPAKSPKAKHSASASTPHPSSERFVYRDKLAIADLKRLQNIDGWFLKAAWAVVNKVHWRKQSLLSYTFHDVNDDGAYEAIVLAQTERRGTLRQSLAIYSFDDDLAPILRFEHHQNIASTRTTREQSAIRPPTADLPFAKIGALLRGNSTNATTSSSMHNGGLAYKPTKSRRASRRRTRRNTIASISNR